MGLGFNSKVDLMLTEVRVGWCHNGLKILGVASEERERTIKNCE